MSIGLREVLPKGGFARGVIVLAGGASLGRVVVIIASPILTRLYTPEEFGLLAVFSGILSVLSVVASLRYEMAIPLPENDASAAHIVVLCLFFVTVISVITAVFCALFGGYVADILNVPRLSSYLWLLPFGVFFMGSYQIFNLWALRFKAFSRVASARLVQSLIMVIVQLCGYTLGPVALLLGQTAGNAAGSASLSRLAVSRLSLLHDIHVQDMKQAAVRWRHFPFFSTWGGLFNAAGSQLPMILFAALFSPITAGLYMLAQRVLGLPMQVLGQAVADAFFPSAAESNRLGRLAYLVAGLQRKLAYFAMPPMLALMFIGPDLFGAVFGEEWEKAGIYAQWMAPWLYLEFITATISRLVPVLEKQKQFMIFQAASFFIRICSILVGYFYFDALSTVAIYAAGNALWRAFYLLWLTNISGNSVKTVFMGNIKALIVSFVIVSPTILACTLYDEFLIRIVAVSVSALISVAWYGLVIYRDYGRE